MFVLVIIWRKQRVPAWLHVKPSSTRVGVGMMLGVGTGVGVMVTKVTYDMTVS
jgi:hypothetical protein